MLTATGNCKMLSVDKIESYLCFSLFTGLPNKEMSAMALGLAHRWVHLKIISCVVVLQTTRKNINRL